MSNEPSLLRLYCRHALTRLNNSSRHPYRIIVRFTVYPAQLAVRNVVGKHLIDSFCFFRCLFSGALELRGVWTIKVDGELGTHGVSALFELHRRRGGGGRTCLAVTPEPKRQAPDKRQRISNFAGFRCSTAEVGELWSKTPGSWSGIQPRGRPRRTRRKSWPTRPFRPGEMSASKCSSGTRNIFNRSVSWRRRK